jgi:hypothetical protein
MPNNRKSKKKTKVPPCASLSGDVRLSLKGFRSTYIPDVTSLKFVYSDYRVLVATSNQAEYVYRAMSLFDPDFTGTGEQPDGFDLWKTLYQNYRVVAVKVEVQAQSNGTAAVNNLLAVAVMPDSAALNSAQEVAGLRKSQSTLFNNATIGRVKRTYHISELYGVSDVTVLSESNFGALISANPVNNQFIHVAVESNASAGESMIWVKLTYYARMEVATDTLDTLSRHRLAFGMKKVLPECVSTLDVSGSPPQKSGPTVQETAAATPASLPSTAVAAVMPTYPPTFCSQCAHAHCC